MLPLRPGASTHLEVLDTGIILERIPRRGVLRMDQSKGMRDQLEAENMANCEVAVNPLTRGKHLATFLGEGGGRAWIFSGHTRTRASTDSL